jgi:hypothetical protein
VNTVLEARIRAASAEMTKPGRWRIALEQLDQAATQLLGAEDLDREAAQLTLENLQALYQWASVMQNHELHRLTHAILELTNALQAE